jgi:hypothetical protein
MLAYVLNQNIDGNKLLGDIQKLISSFQQNYPNVQPILIVEVKSVSYEDTSMIPKLEVKNQ